MSKPFVLANDYALRKQWDKVLRLGRSLPKGRHNVFFNHDIIRALYHTGRLPYDLFHFPQTPHGLLLTHEKKESYLSQLKLCDIFVELGQVNIAERLATEILAVKGHFAIVIEKLAWINIIKGQTRTARIYLNALSLWTAALRRSRRLILTESVHICMKKDMREPVKNLLIKCLWDCLFTILTIRWRLNILWRVIC